MNREILLDDWLSQILKPDYQRIVLAGDASLRRYYRLHQQDKSYVVMDAPPPESPKLFTEIGALLETQGLSVPKVHACDFQNGFLLLEDFGDRLYLNELNERSAAALYEDAFQAMIQMQCCKAPLPHFDKALARQQLEVLFKGWYLNTHLKVPTSKTMELDGLLDEILDILDEQPKAFMHRDYHSRNLMIVSQETQSLKNPGILDFQDALIGPITYDLVSLLQDCYISWPRQWVEEWVFDFQKRLISASHIPDNIPKDVFLRWFDLTGLQRHLKNLGIFSRKYHRDNNKNYLKDIPMPLKYIQETSLRYPELRAFTQFFNALDTNPLLEMG